MQHLCRILLSSPIFSFLMDYMVDMAIRTMITRFLDTHPVVIVDSNNSWTGHYASKHL